MKFPSIKDVAHDLRAINANIEGECSVRLQVYGNGQWIVRFGLPDYDQDHRGFWGCSEIPGSRRFNSREVARDLINQAREAYFQVVAS